MTDMTISQVQERVDDLAKAMLAKGLREPRARVWIENDRQFEAIADWKDGGKDSINQPFHIFNADTIREALDKAEAFVASLPSPEEARLHEFMGALGKVIDLGRETGIDVEYVNPLTATMKKLSENVLTYRREAAE